METMTKEPRALRSQPDGKRSVVEDWVRHKRVGRGSVHFIHFFTLHGKRNMSHTHQLTQPPPSSIETGNNDADKGKRTNSLAFAQSDCHTCATLQDQCDRRRPRCTTCIAQGRNCDGFATSLSWSTKRMFYANPSSMTNEVNQNLPGSSAVLVSPGRSDPVMTEPPGPPLRFRFMGDPSRPKKRRRTTRADYENQRRSRAQEETLGPEAPVPVSEGENHITSSPQQVEHDLNELGIFPLLVVSHTRTIASDIHLLQNLATFPF